MNSLTIKNGFIILSEPEFDPDVVFDCGQCFRWEKQCDGSWAGVAFSRRLNVKKDGDALILTGDPDPEFWEHYFDLKRDYGPIKRLLMRDPTLRAAVEFAPGMRLLRQDPWEALCSFIISQNNNIPRIKGIISRLCENFGAPIPGGGHSFPPAQALAKLSEADLSPLRCGFRAKYILDAAKKISSGVIKLALLSEMPLGDARKELMKIKGVGPKVADCALLFGAGRLECFPSDVWIRRALSYFYPQGFPREFSHFAGIAQQYLFHFIRCSPDFARAAYALDTGLQKRGKQHEAIGA
jgi:N-glycosylase/DNA lyase